MWNGRTLAVVLPTYNEAGSIADCIRRFEALGIVDRIVVVNNNAHPDTSPEVASTSAVEVFEDVQGYGSAIRRGLAETHGVDLVCICEPDATFEPADVLKLLPYLSDVDVVFGSRTAQVMIFSGANMGTMLRLGNYALAKFTEMLFNTTFMSDVGCTFRVMTRRAVDRVEPEIEGLGSAVGYEMMLHVARLRIPFVQIPVRYQERVGESSVTGSRLTAVRLGFVMLGWCLRMRSRRRPRRAPWST